MESSAPAGRAASAVLDPRRWRALGLPCGAFSRVLLDALIESRHPAPLVPLRIFRSPDPADDASAAGDLVIRSGTK